MRALAYPFAQRLFVCFGYRDLAPARPEHPDGASAPCLQKQKLYVNCLQNAYDALLHNLYLEFGHSRRIDLVREKAL